MAEQRTPESQMPDRYNRDRGRRVYEDEPPKKGGLNAILPVIIIVAVVAIAGMWWVNSQGFAKGDEFQKKFDALNAQTTQLQTTVSNAVSAIPNQILSGVNSAMASMTNQINTMTQNVNQMQAQVSNMATAVKSAQDTATQANQIATALNAKIDANTKAITDEQTAITVLTTRVTALEAKATATPTTTPSSSGGTATIPSVVLTASVTDEGTQQTDNSTTGELKISFVSTNSQDVTDVVVSVYIYFDQCASSNQAITSSSYGSWSIRARSIDEIELRGKIARLYANQTRRIYIDIQSWGVVQGSNGARYVTTMDTSNSDVEIIDWNYAS